MANAEWLRKTLAEQFGIHSEAELNEAIRGMKKLDIGVFVNRNDSKTAERKELMACAS
jgi:hypothetical protein